MRIKGSLTVMVCSLLLGHSSAAVAAEKLNPSATEGQMVALAKSLKGVSIGDKLLVKLKNGKSIKGKFGGVSLAGLKLFRRGKSTEITEQEVRQVYELVRKSPAKQIVIGAAVGLGVILISHAFIRDARVVGAHDIDAIGVSSGLGALVGWAIGKRGYRILIYNADIAGDARTTK